MHLCFHTLELQINPKNEMPERHSCSNEKNAIQEIIWVIL
jgi:hypothetical protein